MKTVNNNIPILVFGLLGLVLFLGCNAGKKNGKDQFKHASEFDSTTVEGRINRLSQFIADNPEDYNMYRERSLLHYENGNTEFAIRDINKAIDLFDTAPELWHLKGFYSYVQNQDSLALKMFKRAADLGSEDPETYYQIGQLYFFKGDYKKAEKYYNTAHILAPERPIYYFAKGFLHEKMGNLQLATANYDSALTKDPGFVKALAQLYDLYIVKDPAKAIDYNDRILAVDSLHPLGRFNKGNYYFNKANQITEKARVKEFNELLKNAVSQYSVAIMRNPRYIQCYYNRGYCFFLLDNYNEALADFDKVVQLDPFNEKAFYLKGSIYEYFGDLVSARNNFEVALKINPDFTDARSAIDEIKNKLN